jgi:hypothetical protein
VKLKLVNVDPALDRQKNEQNLSDDAIMPDFRGLTIRDALRKAKERGIELKIAGNGWAVNQVPAPGVAIGEPRYCTVSFSTGQ